MGVALRRYMQYRDILIIIITFLYSTLLALFLAAASLLLCSFFICFFVLVKIWHCTGNFTSFGLTALYFVLTAICTTKIEQSYNTLE